jgi:Sulfotransferase domain
MIPDGLRVINLGLPKSGTTTLGRALGKAGFRVADYRLRAARDKRRDFVGLALYRGYYDSGDPLQFLTEYNALTEINVLRKRRNAWPQTDWGLIEAIRMLHPGARFVLSTRDPEAQAASMRRWSDLGTARLPRSAVPGLPMGIGAKPGELERWIEGHTAFCRHVFAGADDFLEYDIADPKAKARLSRFLGVALPWWGKANTNPAGPGKAAPAAPSETSEA